MRERAKYIEREEKWLKILYYYGGQKVERKLDNIEIKWNS